MCSDSHCKDKEVVRLSYFSNRSLYTGKIASLYWNGNLETATLISETQNYAMPVVTAVLVEIGEKIIALWLYIISWKIYTMCPSYC